MEAKWSRDPGGGVGAAADDWAAEGGWPEDAVDTDIAEALRSTLRDDYVGASDQELAEALDNVLDAVSPAEGFNIGSALSQIGNSAARLASDPVFAQVVRTAAPIAGGALGTVIGGPVGTALGSQLGTLAASALPAPRAAAPAAPPPAAPPAVPPPAAAAPAAPASAPAATPAGPAVATSVPALPAAPAAAPASPVAGGSTAAAQGLVLTQHPDLLRGLLATAMGQLGRRDINGVPAAQLLSLASQVFGQAAADADELMYLEQEGGEAESTPASALAGPDRSLYGDLVGADNLELAEAAGWEGMG